MRARDQLALRARAHGSRHFQAVNAEWRLKALRQVATMPNEDRIAYNSSIDSSCRQSFPLTVSHEIQSRTVRLTDPSNDPELLSGKEWGRDVIASTVSIKVHQTRRSSIPVSQLKGASDAVSFFVAIQGSR